MSAALAISFFLTGCAPIAPSISRQTAPVAGNAYLIASFSRTGSDGYGLVVQDTRNLEETILKLPSGGLGIAQFPPGRYKLVAWTVHSPLGVQTGRSPLAANELEAKGFAKEFAIEPNTAYYLGKFTGNKESRAAIQLVLVHHEWHFEGERRPVTRDALEQYREVFPLFADVPLVSAWR